ncbi:MAG: acyl-CoA dehydrogenase family protein [Acetobacteraceae bacterium]
MTDVEHASGDLLRETAERLFREHCTQAVLRAADEGIWPAAAWTAVGEAGLNLALLPESAGGYGVAVTDALSLLRVAGEHALPLPLAETMLAGWMLAQAGIAVPAGPLTVAPVAGAESLVLQPDGAGWRLTGTAHRVPWGRNAVAAAVLAERDGAGLVALVPREAWTVEQEANVAHEPRDTLHFHGGVTAAAPAGLTRAELRAAGAAIRAQQLAGGLVRLTAMTTQYAQDRIQFGRPIGKFQAIQQNLAVLAGQTAAACAAADLAAEAVADGLRVLPIAAGKARAGEAAGIGASIAHQVHGAIGFTFEHALHFVTRRLWSWRDEFGNETEWNRLLGRHMAAAGADRLWAGITAA